MCVTYDHVLGQVSNNWYLCNDKLVFNAIENSVNSTAAYILFHSKV